MGFIRGAVISIFGFILFLSLILMNFSLTISLSLDYETLQPALKSSFGGILEDFLESGGMFSQENQKYLKNYCLIEKEYSFDYENQTFAIPCEIIQEGKESVVNYVLDNFTETIYYKEYDCKFWECVGSSQFPLVLISEKAKSYWGWNFLVLAALSFVLFALIFLISKNRPTSFISTGILAILSALPFRNLDMFLFFLPKEISAVFSVFFTKAHAVFMVLLVIGIFFILAGILSKIFKWKMKFSQDSPEKPVGKPGEKPKQEVSKSEIRKIVKEELSKKNPPKSRQKQPRKSKK